MRLLDRTHRRHSSAALDDRLRRINARLAHRDAAIRRMESRPNTGRPHDGIRP